jgi:glycosyltransferase involved in cell wall biosynthesis
LDGQRTPYILFVGALQAGKGIEILLEAYSRVNAPPPLVLIGAVWPDSPKVFPPNVKVYENLPHPMVMSAWKHCLFGVAPSIIPETFGNTVAEAMSQGKAVVASRIGSLEDLVADGETGLLVPPGDADSLAGAMQQFIDHPEVADRMGRAGQKRAQLFLPDSVLPQFEAFYQSLIVDRSFVKS